MVIVATTCQIVTGPTNGRGRKSAGMETDYTEHGGIWRWVRTRRTGEAVLQTVAFLEVFAYVQAYKARKNLNPITLFCVCRHDGARGW